MNFTPLALPEVILIQPDVHRDSRGFFLETYHAKKYADGGVDRSFVQDNQSHSVRHTLRGLHAQVRNPQGKLVRAVSGTIFDVAVDIRPGSPSYGRHVSVLLSAEDANQLWVPPGFAHGFCVVSEEADVEYKCTTFYDPSDEIAVLWNDPAIGIEWPSDTPILSERDLGAPALADCTERLRAKSP